MHRRLVNTIAIASILAACNPPSTTMPASVATSASLVPSPTATSGTAPTASGITREEAIIAARAAVPRYATAPVLGAEVGRLEDLLSRLTAAHISPAPSPDWLVWRIRLGEQPSPTGGQGTDVIIDFWDGRVIFAYEWFS
jgi:hypothetical protein